MPEGQVKTSKEPCSSVPCGDSYPVNRRHCEAGLQGRALFLGHIQSRETIFPAVPLQLSPCHCQRSGDAAVPGHGVCKMPPKAILWNYAVWDSRLKKKISEFLKWTVLRNPLKCFLWANSHFPHQTSCFLEASSSPPMFSGHFSILLVCPIAGFVSTCDTLSTLQLLLVAVVLFEE